VTEQLRRPGPINVRLGRPEDREQIVSFAKYLSDGHDYIPDVIDEWLVPGDGVVLVATVGEPAGGDEVVDANGKPLAAGEVIAMTRVTMLSDDEAWLEGIRVDPRVRGLEVATDLQDAELRWIEAHHARVVRYLANEANVGSLRLGARHGLVEIGRWRSRGRYGAHDDSNQDPVVDVGRALASLGRAGLADWAWVSNDRTYRAGCGLYEYRGWAFQELTEERFTRHAIRREVYRATGNDGSRALVILDRDALAGGHIRVMFLCGGAVAATRILERLGYPQVRLPEPLPTSMAGVASSLAAAGIEPWPHAAVIVERLIDPAHPIPAVDPARLVLEDAPRAIAKPPTL
jgi:hypothetical protein